MVLFFSYGMTLRRWEEAILDREKLIYERLLGAGALGRVYWFTYAHGDRALLEKLKCEGRIANEIHVLVPPPALSGGAGRLLYSLAGPFLHRRVIRDASVLKTNQASGGWTALIASLAFSKPLLFRCGYIWSRNALMRGERLKARIARLVERSLLHFADGVMVTSESARDYFASMRPGTEIRVTPNYVNLAGLTPIAAHDPRAPILFVGRLVAIKQIDRLIRACARLRLALHVYGDGPLRSSLEMLARQMQCDATFMGVLPHAKLANAYRDYSFYVLCSKHEGMPKSLIEAMACGLICLGTNVEGIKELIADNVTGYLFPDEGEDAIAETLGKVLQDHDPAVGQRARRFVCDHYSLERATAVEVEMIARATKRGG